MRVLLLPLGLLLAGVLVYSEGTARSDSASVEIVVPLSPNVRDLMTNCQKRTVQVEFYSWMIEGTEYRRKTLSDDDMACMSTEAVMLSVTGLAECAKAAASNNFNSFYVDAQDQCYASNLLFQDDGGSCSQEGTVVYSSTVAVSKFTPAPPSITTFTIDDPVVGTSFTINFEAECSIFYTFLLSYGDEDLGNVRPGDVIPFDVPVCSDVSLTLTPYLEGVPYDSVSALYSPAVVPDVEGFKVTDVEVDSITVQFVPICEVYTYKLFINDVDLGIIDSPKTVTSQEAPDIQTCTELEVRLEAQVQAGEDPYEVSETIMTPSDPTVNSLTVTNVELNSIIVNFDPKCEGFEYKLFVDDEDLGVVTSPKTVTSAEASSIQSPCAELEVRLEAQLEDGADPYEISQTFTTAFGPNLKSFNVTDVEVDSIMVHFVPICEGYTTYKLFINNVDLGTIDSPKTVTSQEAPDIQPCTELEVRLEAQVQAGEDPYEVSETIMTPSGPIVNSLTVTNVELNSIIVNFDPKCEGFEYKLFVDDEDVGVVTSPKTVTSADAPGIQSPCAELEVRLEAQLEEGADPYVISQSFTTADVPTVEGFNMTDVEVDSITVHFAPICEGYTYNLFINDVDLGIIDGPKTVTSQEAPDIQPCTELEVRLEAQVQDGEDPYEVSETIMTPSGPIVNSINVTNIELDSIIVHFDPKCEGFEYKLFVDDEDVGVVTSPKTVTSAEASSIQSPCTELEVRLEAQVEDGAEPYMISGTFTTAYGPGLANLFVNVFPSKEVSITFAGKCEGFAYKLFIDNTDLGIIAGYRKLNPTDLESIAKPCTKFNYRLEAQLPDGADPYVEYSTFTTVSVPDIYNLSVTQVEDDDTKFVVNFEPACPGYTYSVRTDGQDAIIIDEEEGMFTIQHPDKAVDPCTDIVFTVFVHFPNAPAMELFSEDFTLRTRGACEFIDTTNKNFDAAAASCPAGKSLIDSKDLLGADKTFGLTQKFWVNLKRSGNMWKWGDSQQTTMPTTDPLWASPPPTTGNTQCAVYDPVAHTLSAVACTSDAATVCV